MSEITLNDVLSWEFGGVRLQARPAEPVRLSRPVSWAETIRAAMPALPRLRGDEIIIVPSRTLGELEAAEDVSWSDIRALLRAQPVAAVLVDGVRELERPPGIPVVVAPPEFLSTAETEINRRITERRSELFRIGSDLARAMSALSLVGAGVTPVLNVAETISGLSLVLLDERQRIIAKSASANTDGPWEREPLLEGGRETGYAVACSSASQVSSDVRRLILSQTSGQLGLLLDRGTVQLPAGESAIGIGLTLRQLLLGASGGQSASGERRSPANADQFSNLRVALLTSTKKRLVNRVRQQLPAELIRASVSIEPGVLAIMIPTTGGVSLADPLQRAIDELAADDDSILLTVSEPAAVSDDLPARFQQASVLQNLARAGVWKGPVIDACDMLRLGLTGVIYRYWYDDELAAQVRRQLLDFSEGLLEPLVDEDMRRGYDYVRTIAAYLEAGGVAGAAAKRLGVHRNTIAYRVSKIEHLLGVDIDDAQVQSLFNLALAVRRLEEVLGAPGSDLAGLGG